MTVSYTPQVWDVRPEDAGSLSVLPKLGPDDYAILDLFMATNWPDFDIIGTHGEDRAQPGQKWWGIGAIEVKKGPQLFQLQFRQASPPTPPPKDTGNIISFQWFGSAPPLDSRFDVRYYENGNFAFSEGSGDQGWPYGDNSGPFSFWVNSDPPEWKDRRVGSDAMVNVYWFDNHVSLNPVFWPMRKTGVPLPTGAEYLVNVGADGTIGGHIAFVPGPPPAGTAALGLSRDRLIVGHILWTPGGTLG